MISRVYWSVLFIIVLPFASTNEVCEELNDQFQDFHVELLHTSSVRIVASTTETTNTPECHCRGAPCATPRYALYGDENPFEVYLSNISLILTSGIHVLNDGLPIYSSSYISFIGIEGATIRCGANSSISDCNLLNTHIQNSSYVYFYNIIFENCESRISSVHVQHSTNIIFDNCIFRNNPSSAVHLFEVHSVAFRKCIFESNIQEMFNSSIQYPNCYNNQSNEFFFLDSRPTAGAISVYVYKDPMHLLISETSFVNNSARPNQNSTLPRVLLPFGHGGAMFLRLIKSSGTKVCIENSNFTNNTAEANGGAIQISAATDSSKNNITFNKCNFIGNQCELDSNCTGGAIGIDYFDKSTSNQIHFFDSHFGENKAAAGGVIALLTSVGTDIDEDLIKPLWFRNCTFEHNVAEEDGSVMSLFSVTLISDLGYPVNIENCRFERNVGISVDQTASAISVFRVTVTFDDENVFNNNFGGGLTLIESRANVKGALTFHHNFAEQGGGMSMFGRCLVEIYNGSNLTFNNNFALRKGGGMYVEYITTDFIFSILNRGCFLQYYDERDVPPNEWDATITFINNTAGEAGAAMYASDMSRCEWFGSNYTNNKSQPIFVPLEGYNSPFNISGNRIANDDRTNITVVQLATDAVKVVVTQEITGEDVEYSYSEEIKFHLSTMDQFDNFRVALWQAAALNNTDLGATSSSDTIYIYDVPSSHTIKNNSEMTNSSEDIISMIFSVFTISTEVEPKKVNIVVGSCHPGYSYNEVSGVCECEISRRQIVRCDDQLRYVYVQEGQWVGIDNATSQLFFTATIPGFLNCQQEGNLPGCLYMYDNPNSQCAIGRKGTLCSKCVEGYGLTFDLLRCRDDCSPFGGIILYIVVCILTVVVCLVILYFDIPIPNELKSIIFFGQVIGVIYRNSPYLNQHRNVGDEFLSFLVNLLGFSLPFPVCFHENISGPVIAWLGVVPPVLALATAIIYIKCAGKIKMLSSRESYGLHGLHLITLFIYKYFLDTIFIFVNVRKVHNDKNYVFSYSGETTENPLIVTMVVIGLVSIIILAIIAPIVLMVYIYRPQNHRNFVDAFTRGIKENKRYLWYSVWDIWRRLPFVAVNLIISVTTVSIIVLIHVLLVLLVLSVHCITKPYKREYINAIEAAVLFCLLGATLPILDENDIYIQEEISIFFIVVPFVYALCFVIYLIVKHAIRRFKMKNFALHPIVEEKVTKLGNLLPRPSVEESPGAQDENDDDNENRDKDKTDSWTSKSDLREPLLATM